MTGQEGAMAASVPTATPARIKLDRLVVPIDFFPLSNLALGYARRIAQRHGAELILAHVTQPVSPMAVPEAAWYHLEAAQNKEIQQLEEIGAKLRTEGINARTLALSGLLQEEIPCCSQQACSDLIVLGADINSGIERLLFGCDSEVLLRTAGCPVMVVGPKARPAPEQEWHPRNILCASDLRPESAEAAIFAWRLARQYEAVFTLLHVEPRTPKHSRKAREDFEQAIAKIVPEGDTPIAALQAVPALHSPCATIVVEARQRNSDFIVIGAHACSHAATRLQRGIATQVISEASCPVLVLHIPG
jgi:nucleotide-binding universal stress UspA family protein